MYQKDYILLLEQAGFRLHIVSFDTSHNLVTRLLNRIAGHAYRRQIPPDLLTRITSKVEESAAQFVFFNQADYPSIASALRQQLKDVHLVQLSHGLDSTDWNIRDQVHRMQNGSANLDRSSASLLGGKLQFEADYRRNLDASMCISPLDAELERWLGVPKTKWFMRSIREKPLEVHTVQGRVGCVATLDHGPNVHGLLSLFEQLGSNHAADFRFRLVGGPEACGPALADRYPFVEYVGPLSDTDLRQEAGSWCCFVHPIFNYARGCSTKCAVALGWGLPMATTVAGVRGYAWDDAILPLASTPSELAQIVRTRSHAARFDEYRRQSTAIAMLQPSFEAIASEMRAFLDSLPPKSSNANDATGPRSAGSAHG